MTSISTGSLVIIIMLATGFSLTMWILYTIWQEITHIRKLVGKYTTGKIED